MGGMLGSKAFKLFQPTATLDSSILHWDPADVLVASLVSGFSSPFLAYFAVAIFL
ncbi:hypothetical protein BDN71DRAFT_1458719, partial [Pleurotus eryngii]